MWGDKEIITLKECYLQGMPIREISKMMKKSESALYKKMSELKLGHRKNNNYISSRRDQKFVVPIADKHHADGRYGKINAFALAESELAHYFSAKNGVRYYKSRMISGLRDWHEIIRDLNMKLKSEGRPQIDYVAGWVI